MDLKIERGREPLDKTDIILQLELKTDDVLSKPGQLTFVFSKERYDYTASLDTERGEEQVIPRAPPMAYIEDIAGLVGDGAPAVSSCDNARDRRLQDLETDARPCEKKNR